MREVEQHENNPAYQVAKKPTDIAPPVVKVRNERPDASRGGGGGIDKEGRGDKDNAASEVFLPKDRSH